MTTRLMAPALADELAVQSPRSRLSTAGKLGLGTAYVAGFRQATADGADVILTMGRGFLPSPALPACNAGGQPPV